MTYEELSKKYPEFSNNSDKKTDQNKEKNSISNLQLHSGINMLNNNIDVVYSEGGQTKVANGPFFIKFPWRTIHQITDKRETTFDIPVQSYNSKDEQIVQIDWYIKYIIRDSKKMIDTTQDIKTTIREDCETLISSYLKKYNADEISHKTNISKIDFDNTFFKNFLSKYGVEITAINSNSIIVPHIRHIEADKTNSEAQRTIKEKNHEQDMRITQEKADQKFDIESKEAKMYQEVLNGSNDPSSLARIIAAKYNNSNDVDMYHHNDYNKGRRK